MTSPEALFAVDAADLISSLVVQTCHNERPEDVVKNAAASIQECHVSRSSQKCETDELTAAALQVRT